MFVNWNKFPFFSVSLLFFTVNNNMRALNMLLCDSVISAPCSRTVTKSPPRPGHLSIYHPHGSDGPFSKMKNSLQFFAKKKRKLLARLCGHILRGNSLLRRFSAIKTNSQWSDKILCRCCCWCWCLAGRLFAALHPFLPRSPPPTWLKVTMCCPINESQVNTPSQAHTGSQRGTRDTVALLTPLVLGEQSPESIQYSCCQMFHHISLRASLCHSLCDEGKQRAMCCNSLWLKCRWSRLHHPEWIELLFLRSVGERMKKNENGLSWLCIRKQKFRKWASQVLTAMVPPHPLL